MFRIGVRLESVSRDYLQLMSQLGVEGGTLRGENNPALKEGGKIDAAAMHEVMRDLEESGLELIAVEGGWAPGKSVATGDFEKAVGEVEQAQENLRLLGDLGVKMVLGGFNVAHADARPGRRWRDWKGYTEEAWGRGGALLRSFDASRLTDEDTITWGSQEPDGSGVVLPAAEIWRRTDFFYEKILPVAEEAGVRIASHPNDPPMPIYRGVEQAMRDPDGFGKLLMRYPSSQNGLLFCMGVMQESGADMPAALRKFAEQKKVFLIHFRAVKGTVPAFKEVFQDDGDFDAFEMMRLLRDVGYDGYILEDHVPRLTGDNDHQDVSRAWAVGYLRAMRQAAYSA